jgi:pyruvate,water dikinase
MSALFSSSAMVVPFEKLRMTDIEAVGGKNASLGEMISQLHAKGVRVPTGFATTAHAFKEFLAHNKLDEKIADELKTLDTDDTDALAVSGKKVRQWIIDTPFPSSLEKAIELIQQNTRHYAKRQMTWFKRDDQIHWFSPQIEPIVQFIQQRIKLSTQ